MTENPAVALLVDPQIKARIISTDLPFQLVFTDGADHLLATLLDRARQIKAIVLDSRWLGGWDVFYQLLDAIPVSERVPLIMLVKPSTEETVIGPPRADAPSVLWSVGFAQMVVPFSAHEMCVFLDRLINNQ